MVVQAALCPHAVWLLRRRRDAAHRTLAIRQVCGQVQRGSGTEGETIIRKRERFSHELTLAYENGQLIELKETKEEVPSKSSNE